MAVLLLDATASKAINKVATHAMANPLNLDDMHRFMEGKLPPIGNDPNHTCDVAVGYRCTFSVEPSRDSRMVRHLSVSMIGSDKYPSRSAVQALMVVFGFEHGLQHPAVVTFPEKGITHALAVNVVEIMGNSTQMAM